VSDLRDLKPEWRTIPDSVSTVERDGIYHPPLNHVVFNIDTNQPERWDGTKWVSASNSYTPPPLSGPVGMQPTDLWRIRVTKIHSANGNGYTDLLVLGSFLTTDTAGTIPVAGTPVGTLAQTVGGTTTRTAQTLPASYNAISVPHLAGAPASGYATFALDYAIEYAYPAPVAPMGVKMPQAAGSLPTQYLVDYTIDASYDGGKTWANIHTVVGEPQPTLGAYSKSYALTVKDYPANPVSGQTFFNETTQKEMRFNGSKWVLANPTSTPYTPPPLSGPIGGASASLWRVYFDAATVGSVNTTAILFWADAASTVTIDATVATITTNMTVNAGAVANLGSGTTYAYTIVQAGGYIEIAFPAAISPISWTYKPGAGAAGNSVDVTLKHSLDGGTTWLNSDVQTGVPIDNTRHDFVLPVPTYPANPVKGQTFFNETTQTRMRFDGTTWVVAVRTYTPPVWQVISAAHTAVPMEKLMVDTSVAPVTITLPATPKLGDSVMVSDAAGSFATNNCSVDPGTNTLMGVAAIMTLSVNNVGAEFVFTGSDWRIA